MAAAACAWGSFTEWRRCANGPSTAGQSRQFTGWLQVSQNHLFLCWSLQEMQGKLPAFTHCLQRVKHCYAQPASLFCMPLIAPTCHAHTLPSPQLCLACRCLQVVGLHVGVDLSASEAIAPEAAMRIIIQLHDEVQSGRRELVRSQP